MDEQDTLSILAVGARLANLARRAQAVAVNNGDAGAANASVTEVDSGRQALALLRVVPFDLVAVGGELTDMSADRFAQTLRQAKPWQKWVSVAETAETEAAAAERDEVAARTLGALAVVDGGPDAWPQIVELAQQVRRRNPASVVKGLSISQGNPMRTNGRPTNASSAAM